MPARCQCQPPVPPAQQQPSNHHPGGAACLLDDRPSRTHRSSRTNDASPTCIEHGFPSAAVVNSNRVRAVDLANHKQRKRVRDTKVRRVDPKVSDHNVVFVHVRLGGRVAPNRRRRDVASGQPSIDLNRQKAEVDLRRELRARASRTVGPLERVATTVDELATELVDCVLAAAAEIAPGTKRRGGPKGWCGSEEVQRDINAATARREAARRRLRGAPQDPTLRKAVKMAAKYLNRRRIAAVTSLIEEHAARLERMRRNGDHAGFYEHVKGLDVERRRPLASQNIKDEDGNLLRDPTLKLERWAR